MRYPGISPLRQILLIGLSLFATVLSAQNEKSDQIVTYREVDGSELKMHIFLPDGFQPSDRRPAVVFYFGGGWNGGSPDQFYPFSEYLTSRGPWKIRVGISNDFRSEPQAGFEELDTTWYTRMVLSWD